MTWNPNGTLGTFAIADNLPVPPTRKPAITFTTTWRGLEARMRTATAWIAARNCSSCLRSTFSATSRSRARLVSTRRTIQPQITFRKERSFLRPGCAWIYSWAGVVHSLFGIGMGMVSTVTAAMKGDTGGATLTIAGIHVSALEEASSLIPAVGTFVNGVATVHDLQQSV